MSIVRRTLAGFAAALLAVGLTAPAALAPAFAAEDDAELILEKSVNPNNSPYNPGDQFSYTIELTCNSNLVDTCINAELSDTLPAPLVFDQSIDPAVEVSGGGDSTVAVDGTNFTVDFTSLGGDGTGQPAGQKATITVFVQIPADISADYNGVDITNTANATADNALPVSESETITIAVPEVLDSTVTKSVDDHQPDGTPGVPALPDQPVDYTIGGGNASNRSVDEIVVQDPAAGVASPFDGYFDFTGITSITPPAGADQVEIEWLDADGNWTSAYGPGPIPADPSGIPAGVPPADVKGLKFTFSNSNGDQLPPSGDEPASIGIGAETNDQVLDLPLDESVTVPNTASSNVVVHGDSSTPKTAAGDVVISNTGPFVDVTKNFANPNLLAGQQTTATIEATNGFRPVTQMVIQEPTPGQPDLADQGLVFDGFTSGVTWPPNATGASITYVYADGQTETLTADTPNTLPDPELEDTAEVVGFTVTFTGPIIQNATATVPFDVIAQPVDGEDVTTTNETTSIVTDQTGKSGDDSASDDVTRQPGRVSTTIDKNIARDEQWAVPGSTTDVSFIAHVNDQGPNASTVGSDVLVISDPADPSGAIDPFWNAFDLTQIVAGVPANADLQVNYWDGTAWVPLPGGQLDGAGTLVLSVPGGTAPVTQDQIQGIQFVYTPKEGELLPPGFQAAPSITVETRDQFRDGSGSVADAAAAADPLTVPNEARSDVHNDNDVTPDDNTATDGDEIDLKPIDGGEGPDLFEKHWIVDASDPLFAFSEDRRTARISWSTEGVPFDSVAITDDPTAGPDYDDTAIAQSAFDAWNLVEIAPIDSASDASMQYDRVSKVELFEFDEGTGTGAWVDVTAAACGDGTACDGAFPGYELSADEQLTTRAVRLTYAEGSHRGGAGQPTAGSGVAPSYGHDRDLDLVFELRDFKRSDGGPVTGTLHTEDFNSGQPGVVDNTAEISGEGPNPIDQTDSDLITILDSTVNVSVTKQFDQDNLPIPPETTPADSYPLVNATITARNETEAGVQTLAIADPAPGSPTNTYEFLNLYAIDTITVPDAATESTVTLTREGGATTDYTIAEALALTPDELADVIAFSVVHTDADDVAIESKAIASVVLTYQLRQTERSNPANPVTTADLVTNVAGAQVDRPGGNPAIDTATGTATDTLPFAAASYGVVAQKTIDTPPTSANNNDRVENEPREGYTIGLTGQPTGNVRTTVLTITDDDPTFWNQFEFASFPQTTLPTPVRQIRVSALTGVEYAYDSGTNTLSQTCDGDTDLTDCWTVGEWQDADSSGLVDPVLPSGVAAGDVVGLRFEFRVDDAESNWENPINPVVPITFTANQLVDLRSGPNGETDTPVPTTQPGIPVPIAPGETAPGTTTDTVDVHGEGSWTNGQSNWSADDDATDATVLKHLANGIKVVKTPGNGQGGSASQQFPPSGNIPYRMRITNTGQWPITGLELTDQVATDAQGSLLIPRPNVDPTFSFTLTAADGTVLDASGFAGSLDTATGLVTITVPDGFVFDPGDVLVIGAALQFRQGLAPGTPVGNTITATSDREFDTCDSTSNATVVNPQVTDVEACSSNTTVNPTAAAPIALVKSVKGSGAGVPGAAAGDPNFDDLGVLNTTGDAAGCAEPNSVIAGFYRNNCVPITRPGGVETWTIGFTNLGNVPAEAVAGIDVLPAVGDTGVTVGTSRGSQWSPVFIGNVSAPVDGAVFDLYYLTTVPDRTCNAKDIEWSARAGDIPTTDPCYADVSSRQWISFTNATPEAELAQAKALKLVVTWPGPENLRAQGSGGITFQTRTPYNVPNASADGLPIAWNAVAAGSRADYNAQEIYQGPVEPVRSGVAVPTGEIALQKVVDVPDGWTAPLPGSYDFGVQCTSGGEAVTLVDPTGGPANPVTVPADGTVVDYGTGTNLPMYADCIVQEVPSQGSTVTYDPAGADATTSGEVTARRDLTGNTSIHHPAPDEGELEQVTVTNTYALGGFSVTKSVVDGGALDQDGNPIAYDPEFTFTASCTFLGEEVVPADQQEFTLHDGDTETFDALPVGADCTVEETDTAGSTSTSIVVTEDGTAGEPVDGTTADFTILPDDESEQHVTALAVTNTYTVGSIAITKDVTGAGADDWAADSFDVRLVCTWDQATTNPVYDATHTIADGETWTVENLPTGAECTVTEPDDGGATEVVVSPDQPVVIGVGGTEGDPIEVTVTNDYRVGGFDIAKTVSGPGTGFSSDVDFVFHYVCTYEGETVGEGDLTITGDGSAGPLTSEAVTGLPVGTECEITETDAGGADALPEPVMVTIPDEVDGAAQVATAQLDNHFSAGTIAVTKELAGEASDDPDVVDATYTVHVTCAVTDGGTPVYEGDVQVTGGQTVTVTDPATGDPVLLPIGTHCWGDETDDAGATDSSVDHDSFDDAVIVVADDGDEPQALGLTATNTFDLADLVIEKALDGDAASYAEDKTFEILVTCTLDRGPDNDPIVTYDQEPVELEGGEQATLTGIPIGSDCYAEEPDGQGAWTIEISATADDPVVVDGGETPITITVTNVFPDAGFVVTKTVDNGGAANANGEPIEYDSIYRFTATCVFEGETVLDDEFLLRDGGEQTYTGLPAGADCTVEETEQRDAADTTIVVTQNGADDDLGSATSAEFTLQPDVDDQLVNVVAVTNHYTVGSASVVKTVTGTGADAWGGTFGDFEVELVCTLPAADPDTVYDGTHTLTKDAPGDVWLVENLPTGAECRVSEIDDGGATESTVTPETFVVGDDSGEGAEPVQVDIVNDFRTGALNVLKHVAGPGAPAFSEDEFTFQVVCTYEEQTVVDQELVVESDGGEGPFTSDTITGIPVGAECVVTETDPGHADEPAAPVTVTIADQAEEGVETVVTAGFVNEFSLGTVELTKEVDGDAADAAWVADTVFTVQVTCQVEVDDTLVTLYDAPVELTAGETVEIVDAEGVAVQLPLGTHCFGVETDTGGATASSVDFDSYDDAAIVVEAPTAQRLTLTATNTFDNGALELEKTVSGATDQAAGKTFEIALMCVLDRGEGNPDVVALDETVSITAGETKTFGDLPVGADCWAEETDTGGAVAVTVSATEANPVVVGTDDVVTITIDNRFEAHIPSTGVDGIEARLTLALLLVGGGLAAIAFVVIRRRRRQA
ncbi:DUF5979 domain-containing protein [Agromyces endophyticus]|uniref:DUF5979 domain-containing protein n=1 Tax=Agromyces sp. H17E-10 TaxID=2932244 RepID=UPI001FD071D5|nr:DUF5979 domain-containing protein [Agromyces sp. H17E-10]UOQ87774.1 DUF5979 domain-containing protein [Agromyces sp. H17E-10]